MSSEPHLLRRRTPLYLAVIPVTAFLAILPMLLRGPSCGHDFDFHLLSWLEASTQFAHLSFPRWAYTPAFNAGEPRFIFYPPLSWFIGAILGLIIPWNLVPATFTWIALTFSGLTFRRLALRYAAPWPSTFAAVLYLANPYMLFTAYERSAFAELLAAAWLPLLVAAALASRVRILPIAIPLALLWLTNAPAAVMSTYALAFLTLVRLVQKNFRHPLHSSRSRLALTVTAGTALGLSLSAFYILPAAYERRFVQIQMAVIEGMRVSDHFLFHHMAGNTPDDRFHDAVVRTASLIALGLLAAVAVAILAQRHNIRSNPKTVHLHVSNPFPYLPLTLLTLVIAILLTPISLPIWSHLPDLAFLQFPWRLTSLLGLIFALFAATVIPRNWPTSLFPVACLIAALVFIAPAWHLFHQQCDPQDTVPARIALFHSNLGTEATDEYTPTDADPDALHPHDPPYWLIPAVTASGGQVGLNAPAPGQAAPGPAPPQLTLTLQAPAYLVLNRRQYPAWQIHLNHTIIWPVSPKRDDGLITLLLPAGMDTIDLTFIRTRDQTTGGLISALAVLVALGVFYHPSRSRTHA